MPGLALTQQQHCCQDPLEPSLELKDATSWLSSSSTMGFALQKPQKYHQYLPKRCHRRSFCLAHINYNKIITLSLKITSLAAFRSKQC